MPRSEPPLRPPAHQVDPRAKRWWRARSAITAVVVAVAAGVAVLIMRGEPPVWFVVVAAVVLVAVVAHAVWVPGLKFRIHRWEITDEAVYTLSGWFTREWRIAPISRVQTVDTQHGPLQRVFKLATVTVTTASARGAVTIDGLDEDAAAELARTLTATTQATPGDAT